MSPQSFLMTIMKMTEKLYLALLCGVGGEGPSLLFCFTFSSRRLFLTPYRRLSEWCIRRAVVSRVGGVAFVSASATCISLLGGTCLCSGIIVDVSVCPRVCVNH